MNKEFLTEREANNYSPLSLAFLGDSVYDTLVREYLLRQANNDTIPTILCITYLLEIQRVSGRFF